MKFTEEEIKNFKNNPFVKMLIHFAGPEVFDTAIAETEKELTKQEAEEVPDEYVNPIINDKEFSALIDDLELVVAEDDKIAKVGINLTDTIMVQKLWDIIYDLLTYIFNDKAAESIIKSVYNHSIDKQVLWKIANE